MGGGRGRGGGSSAWGQVGVEGKQGRGVAQCKDQYTTVCAWGHRWSDHLERHKNAGRKGVIPDMGAVNS